MPCNLDLMRSIEYLRYLEYLEYFIAEICERETMVKMFSKYISAFDYVYKTLLVLSGTNDGVSIALFATIIGTPVRTKSATPGLVFSISNVISKTLLKTMKKTQ